ADSRYVDIEFALQANGFRRALQAVAGEPPLIDLRAAPACHGLQNALLDQRHDACAADRTEHRNLLQAHHGRLVDERTGQNLILPSCHGYTPKPARGLNASFSSISR